MSRLPIFAIAILVAALGLSAESADAQYSEYEGMQWGAVPEAGQDISWGRAIGVVDAPVEQVASIVHDYDGYAGFMPHFRTSRVLSRRGDDALVYLEVGVAQDTVTLWGQFRIRSIEADDGMRTVEAQMMRGNLSSFRARWRFRPVDDGARTHVEFRIFVDPDLPLPSSIFTEENVRAARKSLRALRRRLAAVASR